MTAEPIRTSNSPAPSKVPPGALSPSPKFPVRIALGVLAVVAASIGLTPSSADAGDFTWRRATFGVQHHVYQSSACACDQDDLPYCEDKAYYFVDEMEYYGHDRSFWYANEDVWLCDGVEDYFGGCDQEITDRSDLYVFTGHGSAARDAWGVDYQNYVCRDACYWSANDMRLGEYFTPAAVPQPGNAKWMILDTCDSMQEIGGWEQWQPTASNDGCRATSAGLIQHPRSGARLESGERGRAAVGQSSRRARLAAAA